MLYSQFSKNIFVAAYIYSCHLLTRPTFRAFGNSYQVISTWRWTGEYSDIQQSTGMQLLRTRMITSFYECRGKEYYLSTCFLCRETRLQQIWRARFQHLSLGCCSGESILFSSTTVSSTTMRSLNHCPKHASIESGICDFICDTPPICRKLRLCWWVPMYRHLQRFNDRI
jgi:hypothetical protein